MQIKLFSKYQLKFYEKIMHLNLKLKSVIYLRRLRIVFPITGHCLDNWKTIKKCNVEI